jgi:hypothetical protein
VTAWDAGGSYAKIAGGREFSGRRALPSAVGRNLQMADGQGLVEREITAVVIRRLGVSVIDENQFFHFSPPSTIAVIRRFQHQGS